MRDGPGTIWPAVPCQVADQIRPLVNDLAEQMVTEISAAVTEYARLSDPVYARNLRLGAEAAIAGFADRIARPHAPRQRLADTFYRIGKVEAAEGRSLEMLQAALRAGARVVMHWLTGAAYHAVIPAETLGVLAEALLIHIDEIATFSAAGYDQVQRRAAEETARRRHRLITLLLSDPAPAKAIAAQASLAGWRLPRLLSVVLLGSHDAGGVAAHLPGDVLVDLDRAQPCLIVPDPEGPGLAAPAGPGADRSAGGGRAGCPGHRRGQFARLGGRDAGVSRWPGRSPGPALRRPPDRESSCTAATTRSAG